jgi:magnesium transporter
LSDSHLNDRTESVLLGLLRDDDPVSIEAVLCSTRAEDLAAAMGHLSATEQLQLLQRVSDKEIAADILAHLGQSSVAAMAEDMSVEFVIGLIEYMEPDDATDVIHLLPESTRTAVVKALRKDEDDVTELLVWPSDCAGGIMSNVVFTVDSGTTCGKSVEKIQRCHQDYESVFYIYVVDESGRLVGVVSLRDVLVHDPKTPLSAVMEQDVITVQPTQDQEEVARIVARYDLLGVPVVDDQFRLLGVVSIDDVVDVIREEAAADLMRLAGVNEEYRPASRSVFRLTQQRVGWLFATCLAGIMADRMTVSMSSGMNIALLAGFIPVVMGMGGNVGVQSATIAVRGLATGHIQVGGALSFIWREIRVGVILGMVYGVLIGGYALMSNNENPAMGGVVLVSVFMAISIGAIFGSALPVVLSRFGVDPAVATGPFVTSAVDLFGIFVYFSVASVLL